jgi:putative endopeptidase
LALASVPKPEAAAADVVAIETELAKLTKTATERRDVQASYNPLEIKKLPKSIDWKAYFKVFGASPGAKVIVTTPKFFAGLDGLRKSLKLPQWASYFTYHLLVERAFALPKAFDDEAFKLQQLVTGVTEKQARFKRCIDATTAGLGELLGRQYVEKYFPPQARQTATMLVDGLIKVMNEELGGLDWMTPASRQAAQAKLGKVVRMIGYPDKWRVYDFEVKRDDFGGNELRASAFEVHRVIARAGKPVDRGEWLMNAFAVNAYYNPRANNSALPAGILQPPFFGSERSVAANLGGIGMAIGHELTHGFDDQGAQFDGNGNLASWWAKDDQQKFEERGKCVATMYSSFEAMPKMYVNGELTLGENIADLGGVKMAFRAYRDLRKDAPSRRRGARRIARRRCSAGSPSIRIHRRSFAFMVRCATCPSSRKRFRARPGLRCIPRRPARYGDHEQPPIRYRVRRVHAAREAVSRTHTTDPVRHTTAGDSRTGSWLARAVRAADRRRANEHVGDPCRIRRAQRREHPRAVQRRFAPSQQRRQLVAPSCAGQSESEDSRCRADLRARRSQVRFGAVARQPHLYRDQIHRSRARRRDHQASGCDNAARFQACWRRARR